jgi:hypothetical protein
MDDPKPDPLVTPQQVSMDGERFAAAPYRIISRFLECFDRDGRLKRSVPSYVLEALAERLILVNSEQANSLDVAFGGCIARQRNAARLEERDWDILCDLLRREEKLRSMSPKERGVGSPTRIAIGECAKDNKLKPSTVRRIRYARKRVREFRN